MRGKLALGAGLIVGYVIGSRAGRPAYDATAERVHGLSTSPTVHKVAGKAKDTLEERAPKVADVVEKAVDAAAGVVAAGTETRSKPKAAGTAAA